MFPGETLATGAPKTCPCCLVTVSPKVLKSAAGFYIGTECGCGPYSRESDYFLTEDVAASLLEAGAYSRTPSTPATKPLPPDAAIFLSVIRQ